MPTTSTRAFWPRRLEGKTRAGRRIALAAALLLAGRGAEAGGLAGVVLEDRVEAGGKTLVLNGMALREATVLMVDVYVAGLYVEAKTTESATVLKPDQAKRLVFAFVRSVGKEKLREAWADEFNANAGEARQALAPQLAALIAAIPDVTKGDVISLTYVPGRGVGVAKNRKEAAVIPGEDFQRVLYSIWLGAHPPAVALREGLLGRAPAP